MQIISASSIALHVPSHNAVSTLLTNLRPIDSLAAVIDTRTALSGFRIDDGSPLEEPCDQEVNPRPCSIHPAMMPDAEKVQDCSTGAKMMMLNTKPHQHSGPLLFCIPHSLVLG